MVFAVRADASDDNANDDDANDDSDGDADDDGAIGVDAFDVSSAITDGKSDCDYSLPRHQRCACHTLNLISTTDADKAERDAQYKKLSRSTFGKCNALWNKYGRSAQVVETVTGTYGQGCGVLIFFCGTPTPTPALKNPKTPTPTPDTDC